MYRITPFFIYIVVFILTSPAHFAVRGFILTLLLHIQPTRIPKTREEQCLERGYEVACTFREYPKPCQVLTCGFKKRTVYEFHELILVNGVPDFTECGLSKICMNGECVHVTGSMPHYRSPVRYVLCKQVERGPNEHVRTRREQCKSYGFDVACEAKDSYVDVDCYHLSCGYEGPNEFYYIRPARKLPIRLVPDTGTWCGDNRACWDGSCTPLGYWPRSKQRPTYGCSEVFDICCPEIEN